METLIFDEKNLIGGSTPDHNKLKYSGAFNFDGREDLQSAILYCGDRSYNLSTWIDWHERYGELDGLGGPDSPCSAFDLHIWRSGPSEVSYEILLTEAYNYGNRPSDTNHFNDSFLIVAKFETGDELSFSIPFSITCDSHYDSSVTEKYLSFPHNINFGWLSTVPESVDWDFGDWENIYVPGDTRDPWRFQENYNIATDFPHPVAHWGPTKDGSILLRVYEDALPPEAMANTDIEPRGYNLRNNIAGAILNTTDGGPESVKVLYDNREYELKDSDPTYIDMPGGTLIFDEFTPTGDMACRFHLNGNVSHGNPTAIDVFNQKLTLQATFSGGSVATRDIIVQVVDDVPIVTDIATMDLSAVDAWTLGGDKLPLSYDYLKDVLYRGVDYNDWTSGFQVTKCEGKYGSIGTFSDDGNPDDPNSASGNTYYMVDPDKITFVAPGQVVTEAVEYSYTDSDGDTANGVLNIVLRGTGLNPDEAITIAPRPGNVPINGGDIPADNPYVPGNPDDPDRDPNSSGATGPYDPMNPNWGLNKDGNVLLRVFESGLPNGSEAGQRNVMAHGYLDIDATVGLASLRIVTGNGEYEFTGDNLAIALQGGTLSLTKADADTIYYEFTLDKPVMHEAGKGINSDEQFVTLIATDKFGNEERMGLEVQIIDDVPGSIFSFTFDPLPAWNVSSMWWDLEDNLFLSLGADYDPDSSPFSIETHNGVYGSFSMTKGSGWWDDGSLEDGWGLEYVLDAQKIASIPSGTTATDETKIVYTDSDGDSTEVNMHVVLDGPGVRPRFTVNEGDLLNGAIIEIPGFEVMDVVNHGKYGTVMLGDDGLWRYMLDRGIDSGMVQGTNTSVGADSFILKLKGYGHETSQSFDVDIIDSVPTFTAGQDRLAYDFGADNGEGKSLSVQVQGVTRELVPGVETIIAGKNGLLTLSPDGSCRYTPNTSTAGTDRFDFTITDSDGDRALATVEASVLNGTPQTVITVQDADSIAVAQISALGIGADTGISTGV